jgi:non-ribosomal peptide synthase protein (TIGR01720 family)
MTARGGNEIAIVGWAGRFPGAPGVAELWRRLEAGHELLTDFTDAELLEAGVDAALLRRSDYVRAWGQLGGIDLFDAGFFGFTPREAELADPQQRLFLECAWEALEDAGHDPAVQAGAVGVFAGAAVSTYAQELIRSGVALDDVQGLIASEKDYLATRVAYKLDLRGPALTVQTACSTSLVAVHLACQSLLGGECDLALAGGVSVRMVRKAGYVHQEGHIGSPDGHCRAFDARAAGTAGGDGVAVVVLKRLDDALADGDRVRAVIKGSAVNNDGAGKVGFAAPSVDGQARVIAEALSVAGVAPDTIGYVEAHGTGTTLGDPIEVAALTQAFRAGTSRTGFCALGSIKTNLGHLDAAAGVTGLIKAALCLERRRIPPSLHFTSPNPAIDFAESPFVVNAALSEWRGSDAPRRAGVSSFGIGGTNAHAVLEEAPERGPSTPPRPWQLLAVSARSAPALDAACARLADALSAGDAPLADVAFTLAAGRRHWPHRRAVVCRTAAEAAAALRAPAVSSPQGGRRPVAFLFPGQGAQRAGMGAGLYAAEPVFRDALDRCAAVLGERAGTDLLGLLFPGPDTAEAAALARTEAAQPALFSFSYALAQLWLAKGVRPSALAGHSLGEYVAACLAGVLSLDAALDLVALRGRLMQELPPGAMTAVPVSEEELRPRLDGAAGALDLAAVNGPRRCVVSGAEAAVAAFEAGLAAQGVQARRLAASHAFHSSMMDPVLEPFRRAVERVALRPPQIPYISGVSGTWIRDDEATDPAYWARQIRATVRFGAGAQVVLGSPDAPALLEVGPGRTLSTLAASAAGDQAFRIVASLPGAAGDEERALLDALGGLWRVGAGIDWTAFHAGQVRHRVALPTYPFERQRYWMAAVPQGAAAASGAPAGARDLIARQLEVVGRQLALLRRRPAPAAPAGPEGESFPATPVQRWLLEGARRPAHFNQSMLMETRERLLPDRVERAVRALVERHDALRIRAVREGTAWRLRDGGGSGAAQVETLDLARVPDPIAAIEAAAAGAQAGLDLERGPLLRVLHMDLGPHRPGRLLLAAHHLAVDLHSWGILLEDLEAAYRGQDPRPATSAFAAWARRLDEFTRGGGFDDELPYWAGRRPQASGLPAEGHVLHATVASEAVVAVHLDAARTADLLAAARARGVQVAGVVLAGLALGLRAVARRASFLVDVEGHGREALFGDVDVSRTVGWFTALYPLVVEARGSLDETVDGVVAGLGAVPQGGVGFGALRYLSAGLATRARLSSLPPAQIRFNYHGRAGRVPAGPSLFAPAGEVRGPERDARDRRLHQLAVDAGVSGGRLFVEYAFSPEIHARETVERLAGATLDALRLLCGPALAGPGRPVPIDVRF